MKPQGDACLLVADEVGKGMASVSKNGCLRASELKRAAGHQPGGGCLYVGIDKP